MTDRHAYPERRGPDRPANGDTAPCPGCARGRVEFNERSRIAARNATTPAWTCDRCGHVGIARRSEDPLRASPVVRTRSEVLGTASQKRMLKAPTVAAKARKLLAAAPARKRRH